MDLVIIGSGSIVRGYDNFLLDEISCRSLLKGAILCGYRDIVIIDPFFDADSPLPQAAAVKIRWYSSLDEIVEDFSSCHAIIASPDSFHRDHSLALIQKGVPHLFIEKPIALTSEDGEHILKAAAESKVSIFVNYFRKYLPEYRQIKDRIHSGALGVPIAVVGKYGKGLLHNGSHLLDLVTFLLGEVTPIIKTNTIFDYGDEDPSIGFLASISYSGLQVPFSCFVIDHRFYTAFELEIIFSAGKIVFGQFGRVIEIYVTDMDPEINGFTVLRPGEVIETSYMHSGFNSVQAFKRGCNSNSGNEAFAVLMLCERIKELV